MFGMFRIYTVGFPVRHQIAETSLPQQLLQMDPLQRPPCPVAASRAVSAVSYAWLVTCRPNPGWHADIIWVESRLCSAFRRYDCAVPLQSFCSTSQDSANTQKLYPTGGDSSNQWNRKIQDVASWIPASFTSLHFGHVSVSTATNGNEDSVERQPWHVEMVPARA